MSTTQDRINARFGLTSNVNQPPAASPAQPATPEASSTPGGSYSVWAQDLITRGASDVADFLRHPVTPVVRGVANAVNEVTHKANALSDWMDRNLPVNPLNLLNDPFVDTEKTIADRKAISAGPVGPFGVPNSHAAQFIQWHADEIKKSVEDGRFIPDAVLPAQSDSSTGKFVESAVQFGTGLVLAGQMFKSFGIASDVPGVAGKALSAVKGAVAQATVFDAYQDKLSNLIESNPSLSNPVTQFLKSDPKDSLAEAMLKQGLEGTVTGLAQDSLIEGLKILKASRLFTDAVTPAAKSAAKEALTSQIKLSEQILNDAKAKTKFTVEPTPDGQRFAIKAKLSPEQAAAIKSNSGVGSDPALARQATRVIAKEPVRPGLDNFTPRQAARARTLITSVAEAAPSSPELYRGLDLGTNEALYKQLLSGDEINLGASSFSTSRGVVNRFAAPASFDRRRIILTLQNGAQAVKVPEDLTQFAAEKEWLSAGKFQIVDRQVDADGNINAVLKQVPSETTKSEFNQYPRTFATSAQAESEAAWLNTKIIESEKAQAPGVLTQDQKDLVTKLAQTKDPDQIQALLQGNGTFNYATVRNQDDAKKWITALTDVMKPEIDKARGGTQVTHAQLIEQVRNEFPEDDPEKMISALGETFKNANDMSAHLTVGRVLKFALGNKVSNLSALADGDPTSSVHMLELGQALDQLFTVTAQVKKATTNVARTLESLKIDPADVMSNVEKNVSSGQPLSAVDTAIAQEGAQSVAARKVAASFQGMNLGDIRTVARRIRAAGGDPDAILSIVKNAPREIPPVESFSRKAGEKIVPYLSRVGPRAVAIHNEYWMNALLSGPKTIATNALSNTTAAFIRPIEYFNAGVIEGNQKMREKGWDLMTGNFHSLRDSWNMAVKALRTGEQGLDSGSIAKSEGFQNQIGGYVGQMVRVPSRILMASDEFFKQMAYRSNIRAQALAEARTMTNTLNTPAKIARYVQDTLDVAFREDGKGFNKAAMEYARDVTFTNPLDPSGIASKLQGITNAHPLTKVILPFVQTPTNIINWTWERTPLLRQLNSDVRAELAAGGSRRAMAQAKLGTGMALWSTAAALAAAGVITGKGPDNPALRKQWRDAGHQPYSVNIGGKQFQYNRLDPLLAPLGIVADMVHGSGELGEGDVQDVALGFASATAANLASKTYLTGIANMMDVLTSGEESRWHTWLNSQAGSYVPNALNQINPDDSMREVRGVVDSLMSRLPGFSTMLPPRRNILGEPILKAPGDLNRAINPFTMMSGVKPDVLETLLTIGQALPMPKKDLHGIDITSTEYGTTKDGLTPYDRMLQLSGTVKIDGLTLRERLIKAVDSPEWKDLPDDATLKAEFASKIIQGYRGKAEDQIAYADSPEFPLLKTAVHTAIVSKYAAKTQGQAGIDKIKAMSTLPKR
jgi:hypothetical protein